MYVLLIHILHGRGRVGAILGDCGSPFLKKKAASPVKKGLQKSLDPGSNPGPGPDMDITLLARYPFLPEAREYVGGIRIEDIFSLKYEPLRDYAKRWIISSFNRTSLGFISPEDKILAFYISKLYLIALQDPIITQRFANAVRDQMEMYLLNDSDENIERVATAFGIRFRNPDKRIKDLHLELRNYLVFRMIYFIDFVKYASRISGEAFRLLNQPLIHGWIPVSKEVFAKILREAFVTQFTEEIEENREKAKVIKKYVEQEIQEILEVKDKFISQYSSKDFGAVQIEAFPPCIRSIIAKLQNGVNIPHQARFFLVTFLHKIGMKEEEIFNLFATAPDFNESMTKYQIRHITGKISGKEYEVPKCETLRAYGLCVRNIFRDNLCEKDWMSHPLLYYKLRKEWLSTRKKSSESQ